MFRFSAFFLAFVLIAMSVEAASRSRLSSRRYSSGPTRYQADPEAAIFSLEMSSSSTEISSAEEEELSLRDRQVRFAEVHFAELTEEAAQGGGIHLEEMADLMGCQNQREAFFRVSKTHFQELFTAQDPHSLVVHFRSHVMENQSLKACQLLS